MTEEEKQEIRDVVKEVVVECQVLRSKLSSVELWKSYHKLDDFLSDLGWEADDLLTDNIKLDE